ncbi:hypothetical protein CR513_59552, partial [Mucuna pruriens]
MGTNVEAYMDDLVVKSTTTSEHCSALYGHAHIQNPKERRKFHMDDRKSKGLLEAESNADNPTTPYLANSNHRPREGRQPIPSLLHKQSFTRLRKDISEDRKSSSRPHSHLKETTPLLPRLPHSCPNQLTHLANTTKAALGRKNGHIKAQALANFIIELTPTGHPSSEGREWFLSMDEAFDQVGSGAGSSLKAQKES